MTPPLPNGTPPVPALVRAILGIALWLAIPPTVVLALRWHEFGGDSGKWVVMALAVEFAGGALGIFPWSTVQWLVTQLKPWGDHGNVS